MSDKKVINTSVFDTETCGFSDKAVILTLSAVRFDRLAISLERDQRNEFHAVLSIPEQLLKLRAVEQGTLEWWVKQSSAAQQAAFLSEVTGETKVALQDFFEFIKGTQLFCRGTDFDPPKLVSLCKDFGVRSPIKYNEYRDVRTYIDAFTNGTKGYIEDSTPDWIVPHNSLHDCWRDAFQMIEARNKYQQQ